MFARTRTRRERGNSHSADESTKVKNNNVLSQPHVYCYCAHHLPALTLIGTPRRKCVLFDAFNGRLDLAHSLDYYFFVDRPTDDDVADKRKKKETSADEILLFENCFYFVPQALSPPPSPPSRVAVTIVFIFNLLYHYIGVTCVLIFHSNGFVLLSKHCTMTPMTTQRCKKTNTIII